MDTELIETYKDEIYELCEKHKVKSLYSFGPINKSNFTKDSDVDLVVDFETSDTLE